MNENNKIKIRVNFSKFNKHHYKDDFYILVVDLECLTEQKSFTNECGTFYIKSFLPINDELYDYECELMDVEDFREEQLKKLLKNK